VRVRGLVAAAVATLLLAPGIWAALRTIAQEDASAVLLREAASAHRWVSYAGTVSWGRGGREDPLVKVRHDHGSGATEYRVGMMAFTLPAPSGRQPDPAAWCLDPDLAGRNYRAREAGEAVFLGRPARVVLVEPRIRGRPTVRLTLDGATGLPLEARTFRPDGSLYRAANFREVEVAPQRLDGPAPYPGFRSWLGTSVPLDRLDETAGFHVLVPDYLPEGFELSDARYAEWAQGMVRLHYHDGVTAFEITQTPILTPAQAEHLFARKLGPRRAQIACRAYARERRDAVVASMDSAGGGAVVRRKRGRMHHSYTLDVGGLAVTLCARADFDAGDVMRVLRSLR
jgi:hypothetical protein